MKKIILVSVLTMIFVSGCTRLPASEETGAGPGEYEGIINTGEIKKENESLKEELDKIKTELEKLENKNENLSKNNDNTLSMLEEARSKLEIVESEDIPQFNTENTDMDGIVAYLKDSSNILDYSQKSIEIIKEEERIIFRTVGYGDNYSQIFIWEEGQKEPELIQGAFFDKEGSYEWLDEYIIITNSKGESRVLDIGNKKVTGSFQDVQKLYLIERTTTILFKNNENKFILYDFENDIDKRIDLENDKYTDFNLQNNNIVFTGDYIDEDGVAYEVKASVTLDKIKEIYEIRNIGEISEPIEEEEAGEDTV